jgi:hypothetical protein
VGGNTAGDQFSLVEPPVAASVRARRRPRDDVDIERSVAEPTGEDARDVRRQRAAVVVLEAEKDVADPAGVRRGDDDVAGGVARCRVSDQREPARSAQDRTPPAASGAVTGEDHVFHYDDGV